jgi:hypothetical protein
VCVSRVLAAVLGAAFVLAAPAGAKVSDTVKFGAPSGGNQQLTVTMSDDALTTTTTLYATYRAVSSTNPPSTADACPSTMTGTRLIDGVTESPGSYSVSRSVSIPLGIYAVCTYRATPASGDPAAAQLQSTTVGGTAVSGGGKTSTGISLNVNVRGSKGTFSGAVTGTATGRVAIQRRAKGRWLTVKRTSVRNGKFRVTVRVHRGGRYRAVLSGTSSYSASRTPAVRVR